MPQRATSHIYVYCTDAEWAAASNPADIRLVPEAVTVLGDAGSGDPDVTTGDQDPSAGVNETFITGLSSDTLYRWQVIATMEDPPGTPAPDDLGVVLTHQTGPSQVTQDRVGTVNGAEDFDAGSGQSLLTATLTGYYETGTLDTDDMEDVHFVYTRQQVPSTTTDLRTIGGHVETDAQVPPAPRGLYTESIPVSPGTYYFQAIGIRTTAAAYEDLGAIQVFQVVGNNEEIPVGSSIDECLDAVAVVNVPANPDTGLSVYSTVAPDNEGTEGKRHKAILAPVADFDGEADLRDIPSHQIGTASGGEDSSNEPHGAVGAGFTGLTPDTEYIAQAFTEFEDEYNLVSNPGFEHVRADGTIDRWVKVQPTNAAVQPPPDQDVVSDTSVKDSGASSVRFEKDTDEVRGLFQVFPSGHLIVGETYTLTARVRLDDSGSNFAGFDIDSNNLTENAISSDTAGAFVPISKTFTMPPVTGWAGHSLNLTVTGTGPCTAWFDNIRLYKADGKLFNGGFENYPFANGAPPGWTTGNSNSDAGVSRESVDVDSGNYAVKLDDALLIQLHQVRGGTTYRLTGRAKKVSGAGVMRVTMSILPGTTSSSQIITSSLYEDIDITYQAPNSGTLQLTLTNNLGAGSVGLWDSLKLTPVECIGATQVIGRTTADGADNVDSQVTTRDDSATFTASGDIDPTDEVMLQGGDTPPANNGREFWTDRTAPADPDNIGFFWVDEDDWLNAGAPTDLRTVAGFNTEGEPMGNGVQYDSSTDTVFWRKAVAGLGPNRRLVAQTFAEYHDPPGTLSGDIALGNLVFPSTVTDQATQDADVETAPALAVTDVEDGWFLYGTYTEEQGVPNPGSPITSADFILTTDAAWQNAGSPTDLRNVPGHEIIPVSPWPSTSTTEGGPVRYVEPAGDRDPFTTYQFQVIGQFGGARAGDEDIGRVLPFTTGGDSPADGETPECVETGYLLPGGLTQSEDPNTVIDGTAIFQEGTGASPPEGADIGFVICEASDKDTNNPTSHRLDGLFTTQTQMKGDMVTIEDTGDSWLERFTGLTNDTRYYGQARLVHTLPNNLLDNQQGNGGFEFWPNGETAPPGWVDPVNPPLPGRTPIRESDPARVRTGQYSARLETEAGADGPIMQKSITLSAGTYRVRGWAMCADPSSDKLYLRVQSTGEAYDNSTGLVGAQPVVADVTPTAANAFEQFDHQFVAHRKVNVIVQFAVREPGGTIGSNYSGQSAWLDDIEFQVEECLGDIFEATTGQTSVVQDDVVTTTFFGPNNQVGADPNTELQLIGSTAYQTDGGDDLEVLELWVAPTGVPGTDPPPAPSSDIRNEPGAYLLVSYNRSGNEPYTFGGLPATGLNKNEWYFGQAWGLRTTDQQWEEGGVVLVARTATDGVAQDDVVETTIGLAQRSSTQNEAFYAQGNPPGAPRYSAQLEGIWSEGTVYGDEIEEFYFIYAPFTDPAPADGDLTGYPGAIEVLSGGIVNQFGSFTYDTPALMPGQTYIYQARGRRTTTQQWDTYGQVDYFTIPPQALAQDVSEDVQTVASQPLGPDSIEFVGLVVEERELGKEFANLGFVYAPLAEWGGQDDLRELASSTTIWQNSANRNTNGTYLMQATNLAFEDYAFQAIGEYTGIGSGDYDLGLIQTARTTDGPTAENDDVCTTLGHTLSTTAPTTTATMDGRWDPVTIHGDEDESWELWIAEFDETDPAFVSRYAFTAAHPKSYPPAEWGPTFNPVLIASGYNELAGRTSGVEFSEVYSNFKPNTTYLYQYISFPGGSGDTPTDTVTAGEPSYGEVRQLRTAPAEDEDIETAPSSHGADPNTQAVFRSILSTRQDLD